MRADNTQHLQKTAAARSERTRRRAIETLDRLQRDDAPVTVAGLARAAGVARSWIYTQPDLLARITTERPDTRPATTDRKGASDESWQRRIELAHQRIKQLSEENRQLRHRTRSTPSRTDHRVKDTVYDTSPQRAHD
jgi:hypothetical protein